MFVTNLSAIFVSSNITYKSGSSHNSRKLQKYNTDLVATESAAFISGLQLRSESDQGEGDDTATNGARFRDLAGSVYYPGEGVELATKVKRRFAKIS